MLVTTVLAGKIIGSYRYFFIVLYEDYTDLARGFIIEFNKVYLERFARNLKGQGAVIAPFPGDIEQIRDEVMAKDWTSEELGQVSRVPALLVISKDFNDFSPRSDPWVIFHFGEEHYGSPAGLAELNVTMKAIATAVVDPSGSHQSLYQIARTMTNERPDLGLVFSLQPNIFGFSIDLVKAGSYLRGLLQDRLRPVGRKTDTSED